MAARRRFVLGGTTRAVAVTNSHSQLNDALRNWHADSSPGSIVHLSRERTVPRDLKLNLSQTLLSFWLRSDAHNFHLQTTQKACGFQRSAALRQLNAVSNWQPSSQSTKMKC